MPRVWLRVLVGGLLVIGVYVGVVPTLWPDPEVRITAPATASTREGLPVRVSVRAWHANVRVLSVRLYVDPSRSTATLSPSLTVVARPRGGWSFGGLDRRTYPRTLTLAVRLPLVTAPGERPALGVVRGTVDVELEVARPQRRGLHLLVGFPARRETQRIPVEFVAGA